MNISRLIRELENAKRIHGDIEIFVNDDCGEPELATELEQYTDWFNGGEKVIRIVT